MTEQNKNMDETLSVGKTKPLWEPRGRRRQTPAMQNFLERVYSDGHINHKHWDDLYKWSIHETNDFWRLLSEFVGIKWRRTPTRAFEPGDTMRSSRWFSDGTLNFAENLLPPPDGRVVLISIAEGVPITEWTGLKLWNDVARCAAALELAGVQPGDRVAGVLINGPEAIICMLATAAIGAIWSSCSPDFGVQGIKDRLSQVNPKVVFSTSSYNYAGKRVQNLAQTEEAVAGMSPKPRLVAVDHFNRGQDDFSKFCHSMTPSGQDPLVIRFAERKFSDPQYIMFSSGTTGLPKCIVHGVGGTLLQHKKELFLHSDLGPGDRLMFFTTCGWMMWNWMVSGLAVGASLVTFDGSPVHPNPAVLWDVCRLQHVTHFGTSPKFISVCLGAPAFDPNVNGELEDLRTILSTGSPLLTAHYDWVYQNFPDVHLASISGGTDIIGCFMLGNPILPVYSGEIQSPGLGMAIESWDENEKPVQNKKGELVCVKPFVSMPVGFLNDSNGERYRKAYFDHYGSKDVWRHGDFIEFTDHGGIVVYGRSDATLNPGGVRIGTSEIYRAVESLPFVVDSLAIGQDYGDDSRVVLFVRLSAGMTWSSELEQRLRSHVRAELTPRHVPAVILPVKDIPYTRSGKKVELAVSKIIRGEEVSNKDALSNPECLLEYEALKVLLNA